MDDKRQKEKEEHGCNNFSCNYQFQAIETEEAEDINKITKACLFCTFCGHTDTLVIE